VLAVLLVGATVTFALTRGDRGGKTAPPAVAKADVPALPPPAPVAPSTIIDNGSAGSAAGSAGSAAPPVVAKIDKPAPQHHETAPAHETAHVTAPAHQTSSSGDHEHHGPFDNISSDDLARRRPGGPNSDTTTHTVVTPPKETSSKGQEGVSGTDGPQDPYGGGGGVSDPGDGAAPDKKAEFFANVGQQQLASGDTAGAAASFKKANELDPKNVTAVIGMGDIALHQGLFGDAIAHLRKAARLSPKSSQVFTLLGEAYLGTGQNSTAADNFKKALQLDPDNARARDGFNEASSRVPPPSDDN
jgi:predicted TPR repeat methyltransferase